MIVRESMKTPVTRPSGGDGTVTPHMPDLDRIAKGTALFASGTVFGLGLNYLYGILLARLLGADEFGLFSLGLALFNILTVLAIAGVDNAALKFVADQKAQGSHDRISGVVRAALLLSLGFGLGAACCLALSIPALTRTIFVKDGLEPVLWWFAAGIPIFTVSAVAIAVLQALQDVAWRTAIKYVAEPILKAGVTLLLVWFGWGVGGAVAASVAALGGSVLLSLIPLRRLIRRTPPAGHARQQAGAILSFSSPLIVALLAASVANRADLLLLGYWWSASDVGVYAAALQTATGLTMILGCVESIATPYLSERVAAADWCQADLLYGTVVRWSAVFALPVCVMMLLFPDRILSMFGERFEAGTGCLAILAVGHLVNAVTACANNLLLWAGQARRVMWNFLLVALVQVLACLALVPRFGAMGAAWGAVIGLLLMNGLRTWQAARLVGIRPFPPALAKPAGAAFAAGALVLALRWSVPHVGAIAQVALCLGSYVAGLLVLGLEQEDVNVCRRLPLIGGVVR